VQGLLVETGDVTDPPRARTPSKGRRIGQGLAHSLLKGVEVEGLRTARWPRFGIRTLGGPSSSDDGSLRIVHHGLYSRATVGPLARMKALSLLWPATRGRLV